MSAWKSRCSWLRFVKTSAANRTQSRRCSADACDDASIATERSPASSISRKSRCRSIASGVVREVQHLERSAPDDVDRPDRGGEALEIHHRPASLPPPPAALADLQIRRNLEVLEAERGDLCERGRGDDAAEDRARRLVDA